MNETFDYIERRIIPQLKWHSDKAKRNKRWFYGVEITTLGAGTAIPIVNVWPATDPHLAGLLSAILGGLVVLAAAIGKLFKFQENWLQYRALAEMLEREEEHYKVGAGEYADADESARNRLLVEHVEGLLASTTSQYITTHRSASDAETGH
jgi:hypothetical protein